MRRFFIRGILNLIGIALCCAAAQAAQTNESFAITAVSAPTPPKIDGTLDDPAWKNAAHVNLGWDFSFQRPAEQVTDAYLLIDAKYLYVGFRAKQREAIVATQHTNDQPMPADDVVRVYVWPAGEHGNEYGFIANPAGTRYEFSSENTAFSPVWDAVAKPTPDGYIVTERIPISVMRGDGRSTWRVQFDRRVRASNQVVEWAHDPAQGGTDASIYSGFLNGMGIASRNARTKPRLALYGLGEIASQDLGGSTSRMGADLSVPITQTSSFVATFHPDYSNVELDQQSISPTAFPRRFSEVRPFFTQGSGFYNNFNCNDCLNTPLLYTPNIPTPRDGYAVEGKQGNFTFGGFDARGTQRNDNAQALSWQTNDKRDEVLYQRVGVDYPGVHDVADYYQAVVGNYHNFNAYGTVGNEQGNTITDAGGGRYREYGLNFYTPKSGLFAAYHEVGTQYAPPDSFVQINDVKGPTVYAFREFDYGPHSFVQNVTLSQDFGRFIDHTGARNYAYDSSSLTINTRTQWTLGVTTGDAFLRFGTNPGGETNQNGLSLSYGANTSTPQTVTYNVGRFGDGFLRSTSLLGTIRLTQRGTLSLTAYRTDQRLDDGSRNIQWLERASIGYQIGPGQSVALGWRKIIGTGPSFFDTPDFINATNFSGAYYRRFKAYELYFAYGSPNRLDTQHDILLKLIRYFGAEKGT